MERVKSKSLFNFRLKGVLDEDIVAFEKKMIELMGDAADPDKAAAKAKEQTEAEWVEAIRTGMDGYITGLNSHPAWVQGVAECDQSSLEVPTSHCGDHVVKSLVHTPKCLAGNPKKPALVYAHGGGAVAGTAEQYRPLLSTLASDAGVVVFNVDYRLAPETTCPNNVLDFYHTVKYISQNAGDLGVDPARIGIAGESGGGYICSGAMVMLAMNGETDLVKLAMPAIPMLSDYPFSSPSAMTKEERESSEQMQICWKAVAGPDQVDKKREDPLLFPGNASDEIIGKMPPTIVWESEFDFFITEATRFANRLRAAGRLLEFVVIPGTKHGTDMNPNMAAYQVRREAYRLAVQEYLVK